MRNDQSNHYHAGVAGTGGRGGGVVPKRHSLALLKQDIRGDGGEEHVWELRTARAKRRANEGWGRLDIFLHGNRSSFLTRPARMEIQDGSRVGFIF